MIDLQSVYHCDCTAPYLLSMPLPCLPFFIKLRLPYLFIIHTQALADHWDRTAQLWSSTAVWVMTGGDALTLEDLEQNQVWEQCANMCGFFNVWNCLHTLLFLH